MISLLYNIDWNSTSDRILVILGLHVFWGALFYLLIHCIHFKGLDYKTGVSIKQKFVAMIHDILVVAVPIYSYMVHGFHLKGVPEPELYLTYLSGAAYFTMHLFVIFYYNLTNSSQIFHHVLTFVAIYWTAFFTDLVTIGTFFLLALQLSHIPLHGRSMLREFGLRYTSAYEFAETAYFFVYIFERLVIGLYAFYVGSYEMDAGWVLITLIAGINIQSFYFSYQMAILSIKKYNKYRERCAKGIPYWLIEVNPDVEKLSHYKKEEKEKIF
jgi:hypothetical protein